MILSVLSATRKLFSERTGHRGWISPEKSSYRNVSQNHCFWTPTQGNPPRENQGDLLVGSRRDVGGNLRAIFGFQPMGDASCASGGLLAEEQETSGNSQAFILQVEICRIGVRD
jgi:hypothetical protein